MLKHMRTTINLPDSLLLQAKKAALEADTTLTQFITDAIQQALARSKKRVGSDVPSLPVFVPPAGEAGFQPGVDLDDTAALLDLMDEADGTLRR